MKKLIIYSTLLTLLGCQNVSSSSFTVTSSNGCPEKPTISLHQNDVQEISLNEQKVSKSGQANANKAIGYTFQGESGQKLSYSTDANICIWIYSPDNQILNSGVLPMTGKYTLQISALRGNTTFDLAMNLENIAAVSNSTSTESTPSVSKQIDIRPTSTATSFSSIKPSSIVSTPSPSVTPLNSKSDNFSIPSPKEAIQNYYAKINHHQYQDAWNIYPPAVQENKELHPKGYNSFIDWWQQVEFVDINKIDIEEYNTDSAIVNMSSKYWMKNGRKIPVSLKFYLQLNNVNQDWKLIKISYN
ncbi:hypothetical protein NIES25_69470 (plasmid) [Nostoc linckia NIES-25]|nr:hypothetical protein NIES25_69470 [Nostoc linckia NIES-25]